MYNTPLGERYLDNYERRFFGESLGMLVDMLSEGDFAVGISQFDELQRGQKIASLYMTARPLLRPDEPTPSITAAKDATLAAIYKFAIDQIEAELTPFPEEQPCTDWRSSLLTTAKECVELDEYPDPLDDDLSKWDFLVECLLDRVLWDRDYQVTSLLDAEPEEGEARKEEMGIDEDYFTLAPPELRESQFDLYIDALRGILPRSYEFQSPSSSEDIPF